MKTNKYSRRHFIGSAAATSLYWMTPQKLMALEIDPRDQPFENEPRDQPIPKVPEKGFRLAKIGVGSRGWINLLGILDAGATLVAMCDVDERYAGKVCRKGLCEIARNSDV